MQLVGRIPFTATRQVEDVQLFWSTSTEINNDHFVVERSVDGAHFMALASIIGQGTTSTPHDYSWTDYRPGSGQWYYRLRQVDLDGQVAFSPIVTVQLDGAPSDSRIYPNPVSGNTIILQRQANRVGDLHVQVIAPDQSVVMRQLLHQQKGGNQWELSLPDVHPGIYFLRLQDDQRSEVIRFCVSR
ncbi:MAG: T9SS type A sorting domain-containing protein [Saprospiraceae bacterium]|nr:T9SS type A sorting domain-containing protein [Saprospiraceae bacterium]